MCVRACVYFELVFCSFVCSYLILEYVSGGELFDYLVKRVRLPEKEVRLRKYRVMLEGERDIKVECVFREEDVWGGG